MSSGGTGQHLLCPVPVSREQTESIYGWDTVCSCPRAIGMKSIDGRDLVCPGL